MAATTLHAPAVVLGGGVIGLAVFRALAASTFFPNPVLLEKSKSLGQETSSRNSGVVHSGIYHPEKMLKGSLARRGRDMLYEYCKEKSVNHKRCGKIVVARDKREMAIVRKLHKSAANLGVPSPELLKSPEAVKEYEPNVSSVGGVRFSSSGVVDVPDLMLKLQADAEENGGVALVNSKPIALKRADRLVEGGEGGWILTVLQGEEVYSIQSKVIVNCCGHSAPEVYTSLGLVSAPKHIRIVPSFQSSLNKNLTSSI